MMQWLGGIVIVITTTLFGVSFVVREKFRLHDLKEVEKGIVLLQSQVKFIGAPLGEVFQVIGMKIHGVVGVIFSDIGSDMESRKGETAEEIWERIWVDEGAKTFLTGKDLEEVISFGKAISFLERNDKENGSHLLLHSIRSAQEEVETKLRKNQKMYYSLGVLSGLLLVVTLM